MLGVEMNLAALARFHVAEGCEEPSVLAAGVVRKAADIGFIDGVQEWAVTLKKTKKKHPQLSGRVRNIVHKLMCKWQTQQPENMKWHIGVKIFQ